MVSGTPQIEAVRELIGRLLGEDRVEAFELEIIPEEGGLDVFELEGNGGRVVLRGSTGVVICSALNHYLQNYCHASVSMFGRQLSLPAVLPSVPTRIRKQASVRYRYLFNNCTFGYSMPWWDWDRWEEVIDWMALNGYNLPLAMVGHECVWRNVYRRMGFRYEDLVDFFPGPAYFPWWVMGNLDGWGGPLPESWFEKRVKLQQRILDRERALGMKPVLQAFSGHVPQAIKLRYPDADVVQIQPWVFKENFQGTYFLSPNDPLFRKIGAIYIEEQTKLFGTDHFYAADSFNEMTPPSNDPEFLANSSKAVFEAMQESDPDAVWVMMAWIIADGFQGFWQREQVAGLFGGVPDGRLLLLDLTNDWDEPRWKTTDAYLSTPYIANVIMNFGGKVGLGNPIGTIARNYRELLSSSRAGRVCGMGIAHEGFDPNPIVYDFVGAMYWGGRVPDPDAFASEFCRYRYGKEIAELQAAWVALRRMAYDHIHWGSSHSVLCQSPQLDMWVWEHPAFDFYERLPGIIGTFYAHRHSLGQVDSYRHDLVHLLRELLAVGIANKYFKVLVKAFEERDRHAVEKQGAALLELILDIDRLLGTRPEYLLGRWISDARQWGDNEEEKALYEYNARKQITTWGPLELPQRELNDYAAKQWSGLLRTYYYERWRMFIEYLLDCLKEGRVYDKVQLIKTIYAYEMSWSRQSEYHAEVPTGDSIQVVGELMQKYSSFFQRETR